MMLHQFILVSLVASIDVQCHAFKEVKGRSTLANPCHRHNLKYCVNSARSIISIRGGSGSEEYDEDEYDDTPSRFIASFESELAEIRRDAEMEAENEMQMLRGLIEQKSVAKEDEKESEYHTNIDGSNENEDALDSNNVESTDGSLTKEETIEELPDEGTTEVIDQPEIGSDKALHDDGTVEDIQNSEVNSDVGDEVNEEIVSVDDDIEDDKDLQHNKSELPVDPNELSDNSAGSDSKIMGAESAPVISTNDSTIDNGESAEGKVKQEIKPKTSKPKKSKKKSKMSKKGKNKVKKRRILSKEISDEGQEDTGGSVLLTCAQDELTQPRESGILFYLRSDLGRALCLFVATISLAILTQRMQRQMEAEGI